MRLTVRCRLLFRMVGIGRSIEGGGVALIQGIGAMGKEKETFAFYGRQFRSPIATIGNVRLYDDAHLGVQLSSVTDSILSLTAKPALNV